MSTTIRPLLANAVSTAIVAGLLLAGAVVQGQTPSGTLTIRTTSVVTNTDGTLSVTLASGGKITVRQTDIVTPATSAVAAKPSTSTPAPTQKPGVTLANYLRIADGMSYRQVVEILGGPGQEMSRNTLAGMTTVMYMWSGVAGANMNAMFQNDRLMQKAQFGLK